MTKISGNWKIFLRNDEDKELFRFLLHVVVDVLKGKEIYAIIGDSVLTSQADAKIKNLSHVHKKV